MKRNLPVFAALLLLALAVPRPSGANDPSPPVPSQIEEPPSKVKNIIWFRGKWVDMDDFGRRNHKQRPERPKHPRRARPEGAGPAPPPNPAATKPWPKMKPA